MKRAKLISVLLILALLTLAVCADDLGEQDPVAETSAVESMSESTLDNGSKYTSAFILLGAVTGAMIISAFIYRARDKGKYL